MNFQTNSEYLNIGSQGYTQMVSPMKNIQFVNNKKKFFADNVHHKQNDYIFGSKMHSAYGRDGKEAVSKIPILINTMLTLTCLYYC